MDITVEEIKADLARGRATLRLIKSEEAWYAESAKIGRPDPVVKNWSVGVDALTEEGHEDGTYGEFALAWYRFKNAKELNLHVEAFTDSFVAIRAVDGLLEGLFSLPEDVTPEQVESFLIGLGFKDVTPRQNPYQTEEG